MSRIPLPSKKVLFFGVFALLCLVGIYVRTQKNTIKPQKKAVLSVVSEADRNKITAISDKDSDNDGLPDWGEVLWHSNPNNPDSDGDNIPDGLEVQNNTDPTIPAPNDKITSNKFSTDTTLPEETKDLTATDRISRAFLGRYLELQRQNGTVDSTQKNTLVDNLLLSNDLTPINSYNYSETDLKLDLSETPTSIRAYGNAFGTVIIKNSPSQYEDELFIFQKALASQSKTEIQKLDPIIARYRAIVKQALALAVPASAATQHRDFINTINTMANTISAMRNVFIDPVTAMVNLTPYVDAKTQLEQSVIFNIQKYFSSRGVVFTPTEYGYTFRPTI